MTPPKVFFKQSFLRGALVRVALIASALSLQAQVFSPAKNLSKTGSPENAQTAAVGNINVAWDDFASGNADIFFSRTIQYSIRTDAGTFTGTTKGPAQAIPVQRSFAYAVDSTGDHISAYVIDPASGGLTQVSILASLAVPLAAAVDPSNKFVYVVNSGSNNVSAYAINRNTGALTQVIGSPFGSGSGPQSIVVHPSGRFVYVASPGGFSVSAYAVAPSTGTLSAIATVQDVGEPWAITADPSGRFVYVANFNSGTVSAYTVATKTGALTQVGLPFAAGTFPVSLTVDPTGKFLYVANFGDNNISAYTISSQTGALTQVIGSPFPVGSSPGFNNSVTADPSGRFVYVAAGSGISGFRINATTGALAEIIGSPFSGGGSSVATEPSGKLLYSGGPGLISGFDINNVTGALVQIFQTFLPAGESVTTTKGFLNFPLAGIGPETASINTIFDHVQARPYSNQKLMTTAYTGETGACSNNANQSCRSPVFSFNGFRKAASANLAFRINGHYTAGGNSGNGFMCPATACNGLQCSVSNEHCNEFLYYQGHPGIDYRASCAASTGIGTPVYAAAAGTVHYPCEVPVGCTTNCEYLSGTGLHTASLFHVLELDLDSPHGYKIYYLHMSSYPGHCAYPTAGNPVTGATDPCGQASLPKVGEGAHVNAGQLIGLSGDAGVPGAPHLHFEVHHNDIPVDPYGWTALFGPVYADPYKRAINTRVWNNSK